MDDRNSNIGTKIIVSILLFLLAGIGGALALGVSTPYWQDHPLEMYPGQERDVSFLLVNRAGNPTTDALVTLDESAGVAEITSGEEYTVPPEARDVRVVLKVSIPDSASIGDSYEVKFSVREIPEEDQGGNVQLGVGYGVTFPITVVSQGDAPEQTTPTESTARTASTGAIVIWIVMIIIIILLIAWLFGRKKQASSELTNTF